MWICVFAQLLKYDIKPQNFKSQKIKILDSKEFKPLNIDGVKITELSDLAYDKNILYGVGDQGVLYSFSLLVKDKKIQQIKPLKAMKLKSHRDAEGLDFVDGKLLVSFERKPSIEYFTPHAKKIKTVKIAKELLNIDNYRGKNKALEAVAYSKKYGVVTVPELPLKGKNICTHTIYTDNKRFDFLACGCVTALEFIDENKVLVLLRDYSYTTGQLIVTLLSVDSINGSTDVILKMDSQKGWHIDNFEGLTKIADNLYLMVSDDNENILQKTIFVLFELK